ncbi:MAG: DUF4190 domain-containing protein [Terriglobales bacterium]
MSDPGFQPPAENAKPDSCKFCGACGQPLELGAEACPRCGASHLAPPLPPGPAPPPRSAGETNGMAIASLVLGIMWLYWLGSILAIVFGHVALAQIRRSGGSSTGRGMAIAGLVLGYVGVAMAILIIVLALSLPMFMHGHGIGRGVIV